MNTAVQVTMYLNESDQWHHKPLYSEILQFLRKENVAGVCVVLVFVGFYGRNHVHTSSLVDAGGNLPVVIIFVDFEEHVMRVLPRLREMAAHRLIVRENVVIEQGNLD